MKEQKPPQQPKPQAGASIPSRSKEQEIESIKRTLYNALDRLEKLKK